MIKEQWKNGVVEELKFWDYWFTEAGYLWPDDYKFRINPDTELQDELKKLLDGKENPRILDVGAGPLTFMGKNIGGKPLTIIPIDALADEYDVLLDKHQIIPFIRTKKWDSEEIIHLPSDFGNFDLIVAQNTLDHSYDPVKAIASMPILLKEGGVIWMKHFIREADRGSFQGLHQWNFYYEDGLIIEGKEKRTNMTEYFESIFPGWVHVFSFTQNNEIVYIIKKPS